MSTKKRQVQLKPDQVQSSLIRSIGHRMREAREIANMSQTQAAKLLGYKNSSKLAKVENASDTNSIPHSLIVKAAQLYDVSIDFLYGTTDDFELDARKCIERDVSQWVFDAYEVLHLREMKVLKKLDNKIHTVDRFISQMLREVDELNTAFNRFLQLNTGFEENMRGGSRLLSEVERIKEESKASARSMSMLRKDLSKSEMGRVILKHMKEPPQINIGPVQDDLALEYKDE